MSCAIIFYNHSYRVLPVRVHEKFSLLQGLVIFLLKTIFNKKTYYLSKNPYYFICLDQV